ncbi:menaquinol-cytochrome c reductase iron-sulfur subunit precursor [Motilibacter rhizosphaerae]|uniref:Cytochrome bc1 complex Rieske iron-sulfur subunit n=1 Tax=Motilibacter rhizosphaerae TaxID=598652 RepID=A0A4Q7NRS7_9ACTN|nr:ubiquinol-cytochrome c reductase iron-sulfur subunit [Motilibacter rhizosphaerae]RZS89550.1 menaquinol-cytochrome c reductase iron-sulfur subunit precursor [Motilibacter rhizosphaerae]
MSTHDDPRHLPTSAAPGSATGTAPSQAGALEERFTDPGLPAHVHRTTDTDPKAAARAERQISMLFALSLVGTVIFVVGYFAFGLPKGENYRWSTLTLGGGMALALFTIGAGAIQWAKKLMPDEELVEKRKPVRSSDEDRQEIARILTEGGEEAGFLPRRKMIWASMTGAMGAAGLMAVVPLKDLWTRDKGESPEKQISHTLWGKGTRLAADPTGQPIKPSDVKIGGVMHVLPAVYKAGESLPGNEGRPELDVSLNDRAKAAVLVMRLAPGEYEVEKGREGWDYDGIFAYSKICTHVGCPVGLYEQTTHHLLCPCHQSTFDATRHCKVIFGPAARPLPQLAITVDADGYLVAQGDFHEPVGPSFWERG